ncbi:E3 ubiquitin-protein ligase WAV3-like [Andrographis paniculata]|uniref:E3 ubiquitin-protein ligase WAV3-like n=1 Tax=Andrographis paniculata TaxID=175694 RepID=UPI0021E8251C|nr:E3 ubiquitin-protein ligase WAV3-like [Andrographis paniculata]
MQYIPKPRTTFIEGQQSGSDIDVLIQIEGPGLESYPRWYQRAPLDLVMVVDISTDIDIMSFCLVQNAIKFVANNLGPKDRFSIVSCTTPATRLLRLCPMDSTGLPNALHVVSLLVPGGPTDFVDGLKIAAQILEERIYRNPVASIIVLSNVSNHSWSTRQPSCGINPEYLNQLPDSISPRMMPPTGNHPFPVHAFGLGVRHDPLALYGVSLESSGTYSYVESYAVLQDAVATCLGGLQSVVAQNIRLNVSTLPLLHLQRIQYAKFNIQRLPYGAEFNIGNLYANERKFFLVTFGGIPETTEENMNLRRHVRAFAVYTEPTSQIRLWIIDKVLMRAQSIQRNLTSRDLGSEHMDLLSIFLGIPDDIEDDINRVESVGPGFASMSNSFNAFRLLAEPNSMVKQWLWDETMALVERIESAEGYENGGLAFLLSKKSSHEFQRATTSGCRVIGFPLFVTWSMTDMLRRSCRVIN